MWYPQQGRGAALAYKEKALSSFAHDSERWDSSVLPTLRSKKYADARQNSGPRRGLAGLPPQSPSAYANASAAVAPLRFLHQRTFGRFRTRVDVRVQDTLGGPSILAENGGKETNEGGFDEDKEGTGFLASEEARIPFRLLLRTYLATGNVGVGIDVISCTLSVLACVLYVWSTYDSSLEVLFLNIETGICVFFLFEYMLRFYVTNHRLRFVLGWFSLVDLVTIVPVLIDIGLHAAQNAGNTTTALRIVRFLRVLRIARLLRIHRMFTYFKTELGRETARFILNMISITFITAACIYAFENSEREQLYAEALAFHDAYYFTIVTVSTVGFGDINVLTELSRAFIVVVIVGSLVYIPMSTNALLRLLSEDSMYRTRKYRPRLMRHVLVLGEMHADGALKFLQEFFHPDHGTQGDVHVVFLMENIPSAELKLVLESQRYEMLVTYLQGSVHSIEDLDRARAWDVAAVFVLARKFTIEEKEVDRSTMMIALAIKQYHQRVLGSSVQVCLQLIRPESQRQYELAFQHRDSTLSSRGLSAQRRVSRAQAGPSLPSPVARSAIPSPPRAARERSGRDGGEASEPTEKEQEMEVLQMLRNSSIRQTSASSVLSKPPPASLRSALGPQDIVICTNQLKMHLMAKNCLCPGITTFVANLVISLDDDNQRERGAETTAPWEKEYRAGCDFELYRTKLSSAYSGIYFEDLALALYMETGTLIIGVEVSAAMVMVDGTTRVGSRLLLNPVGFVIPSIAECTVHAIVIAKDRASANLTKWGSGPAEPVKGGITASFYGLTGGGTSQIYSSMTRSTSGKDIARAEKSIESRIRKYNPTELRPGEQIESRKAMTREASRRMSYESFSDEKSRSYSAAAARLEAARIHSSLTEEHPNVKDHVVFIGSTTDLAAFVGILRKQGGVTSQAMTVVVLSTTMPSVEVWAALPRAGRDVYIIEGSPLDTYDLRRAGVSYASCAVVSTTQGQMKQAGRALSTDDAVRDDSEALAVADADAIFAHQGILRLNPDIEIITEVVNAENIVFLETKSRLLHKAERHLSFHVAPKEQEQNGKPPRRTSVPVRSEAAPEDDLAVDIGKNDRLTRGLVASGTIFTISLLDALLAQSFYNPKVLAVLESLVGSEPRAEDPALWAEIFGEASSSLMYLASVPEEFEEATYGDVFRHFCLDKGMLAVGVSRGVAVRRAGLSSLGNRHRYVLTNPPAETVLQRQDKIYVLSLVEPLEEVRSGGMMDVLSAFQKTKLAGNFGQATAPRASGPSSPAPERATAPDAGPNGGVPKLVPKISSKSLTGQAVLQTDIRGRSSVVEDGLEHLELEVPEKLLDDEDFIVKRSSPTNSQ